MAAREILFNGIASGIMQPMLGDTAISILRRLIDSQEEDLSAAAAEAVLHFHSTDQDQTRLSELAEKSSGGVLSPSEAQEYDEYLEAADLISLWKSKARLSLKHQTSAA